MGMHRVFFGFEVRAPWEDEVLQGRKIEERYRHVTLAFLGNLSREKIEELLKQIPKPEMPLGPCAILDHTLLLPESHPRVMALHMEFLDERVLKFQKVLMQSLHRLDLGSDQAVWLPHVSLCRKPFSYELWQAHFVRLPCYLGSFHLYESVGELCYKPLWSYDVPPPFEEIEHRADIAYCVHGKDLQELYVHASMALAFQDPHFLTAWPCRPVLFSLEELVMALNEQIAKIDHLRGCPFKAVSFHGEVEACRQNLLKWDMIVDV